MALLPSPPARRALWARAYARRRLGTQAAAALSAPHYALIGERRGYRPNGFFDPRFYREAAGLAPGANGLLGHYLARPDAPSPSPEFDSPWYAAENPGWRLTHSHPFLHFLEAGFPQGLRPRADIDMGFVRDVVRGRGGSMEEAALRIFDPKPRDGALLPPLSREALRARQDAFIAATQLRVAWEPRDTGRKRLVFVQAGAGFDAQWLAAPRDFDVLLNVYSGSEPNPAADAAVIQTGTKTTAIRRLLEARPDLLLRYEAVLFLDDDVELRVEDIDALFAIAARENLDLAQPALTADSDSAWPFLKKPQAPDAIFRASTVEIMAPLVSRRALAQIGWTFAESVSGWGTDLLLGPSARAAFGPDSVGIIGQVAARHARPVDTAGGAFYRYLAAYGIDPAHEANRVVADFGVERHLRLLAPGEAGPTLRARTAQTP